MLISKTGIKADVSVWGTALCGVSTSSCLGKRLRQLEMEGFAGKL